MIWKKLLMCEIEKVEELQCKLSFRLLSNYIGILLQLINISTSIMSLN